MAVAVVPVLDLEGNGSSCEIPLLFIYLFTQFNIKKFNLIN